MKSKSRSQLKLQENIILLNEKIKEVLSINNEILKELNSEISPENSESFVSVYKEIFNKINELESQIGSTLEPFAEIAAKDLLEKSKKRKTLTLDLITNKNCNMSCSYCFEKGKFENKEITEEQYNELINFIIKNHEESVAAGDPEYYNLMIIGGEPSLSKNLSYFLKEIQKRSLFALKIHLDY